MMRRRNDHAGKHRIETAPTPVAVILACFQPSSGLIVTHQEVAK